MNGIFIVDKPEGWTSHDVVGKLRGAIHEKRVGHGGTLDPIATGVLPVFVGRATRAAEFCASAVKRYTAGIRFGVSTDTQDITGNVLKSGPCGVSEAELAAVLPRFTGPQKQLPPMYSAIKIGGRKLCDVARRGGTVEREPRDIEIKSICIAGRSGGDFILDVVCSKGTYIRTLCSDIGDALGVGAAMSSLRRTAAGRFVISDAVPLADIVSAAENGEAEKYLLPVDSLFRDYPEAVAEGEALRRCLSGSDYPAALPDGFYRVYSPDGGFLMLGRAAGGAMSTVKSFFEVSGALQQK